MSVLQGKSASTKVVSALSVDRTGRTIVRWNWFWTQSIKKGMGARGGFQVNRKERRRLQKQGVQVPKDPAISIKLSDLGSRIMTPEKTAAMNHEINRQILEADERLSLDLDSVVLWTLYQYYGW